MKKEKMVRNIFIIGATSGIGYALTWLYLQNGNNVYGFGRDINKLSQLKIKFVNSLFTYQLDIRNVPSISDTMNNAICEAGIMDTCIVSSSVSKANPDMAWEIEEDVIHTNVQGYTAMLNFSAKYFLQLKKGHLVGLTSIAKYLGNRNPAYSASKAFESIYLEGLRYKLEENGIYVTEIIPGFVDTPMISNRKRVLWVVPVEKAARQIAQAIETKKRKAIISRRWIFIRWIIPLIPFRLKRLIIT